MREGEGEGEAERVTVVYVQYRIPEVFTVHSLFDKKPAAYNYVLGFQECQTVLPSGGEAQHVAEPK